MKKKYRRDHQDEVEDDDDEEEEEEEEDSDLASLAREFAKEEIQDSPFLRRKETPPSRRGSSATTPLPEQDAPFVSSFAGGGKKQPQTATSNAALDSFMRFDKKYADKKNKGRDAMTTEDTDDVFTDQDEKQGEKDSPSKIVSELEDKIRPQRRRSSSSSSRLKQKAEEKNLRLNVELRKSSLTSRAASATPDLTVTPSPSPRSPAPYTMTFEDLHDIEELDEEIAEDVVVEDVDVVTEERSKEEEEEEEEVVHVQSHSKDEGESDGERKRKEREADKGQRESRTLPSSSSTTTTEKSTSSTATTTLVETKKSRRRTETNSRPSKKDKVKKRGRKSRSKEKVVSCHFCAQLCSYHRSRVPNDGDNASGHVIDYNGHAKPKVLKEESIQVGFSDRNHYLFDPSLDQLENGIWKRRSGRKNQSTFRGKKLSYVLYNKKGPCALQPTAIN